MEAGKQVIFGTYHLEEILVIQPPPSPQSLRGQESDGNVTGLNHLENIGGTFSPGWIWD
jgi:hypothetical protein